MNRARNLKEFKAAMAINSIPMFNTGYADKSGNIYYVYMREYQNVMLIWIGEA
jgi:acyl-homoserine lactone acylase PvdQ